MMIAWCDQKFDVVMLMYFDTHFKYASTLLYIITVLLLYIICSSIVVYYYFSKLWNLHQEFGISKSIYIIYTYV